MSPFLTVIIVDAIIFIIIVLYKTLEIRKLLNSNIVKVYIRMPNRKWAIYYAQKSQVKNGWSIKIKDHKTAYSLDPECIDYMGLLRIPTGHWNYNKADMIDFNKMEASSAIASNDYYEQNEHHVMQELLYTLKKEFFTPTMTVLIIVVVLFIGFFFIYQQTSEVKKGIANIEAQLVPVEDEESVGRN